MWFTQWYSEPIFHFCTKTITKFPAPKKKREQNIYVPGKQISELQLYSIVIYFALIFVSSAFAVYFIVTKPNQKMDQFESD